MGWNVSPAGNRRKFDISLSSPRESSQKRADHDRLQISLLRLPRFMSGTFFQNQHARISAPAAFNKSLRSCFVKARETLGGDADATSRRGPSILVVQ